MKKSLRVLLTLSAIAVLAGLGWFGRVLVPSFGPSQASATETKRFVATTSSRCPA